MSYHYENHRHNVFTEDGQKDFLAVRDRTHRLLKEAGAATMERLTTGLVGLSWNHLACVDRLVELGEILEVPNPHATAGQYRIFIKAIE